MAEKPETRLVKKWMPQFQKLGWFEKIQQRLKRGTSDYYGCVSGRFVVLEWKSRRAKGKASPLQVHKLKLVKQAGGLAFEVDENNVEQILEKIRNIFMETSSKELEAACQALYGKSFDEVFNEHTEEVIAEVMRKRGEEEDVKS